MSISLLFNTLTKVVIRVGSEQFFNCVLKYSEDHLRNDGHGHVLTWERSETLRAQPAVVQDSWILTKWVRGQNTDCMAVAMALL